MNYHFLAITLLCNVCFGARNPFMFGAVKAPAESHVIGRGMIHDKHVACEAYTTDDGSIKIRLIK